MRPCLPAEIEDFAVVGAELFAKGAKDRAAFAKRLVAEFGDGITPNIDKIYARAETLHSLSERAFTGKALLTPEERASRALAGDKKRIVGMIERLREKTEAGGDFTKTKRKPPRMDEEKARLLYEYDKAREAYNRGLFDARLRNQSIPRKVLRTGGEVINTARAVMTSFDLSAVLRQGGFITFAHPIRALQSFPAMFRAFGSERAQHRVNAEIMSRPNAPKYVQSKLYLADESAISLNKMEEAYMSRWAKKIPGVAGSQRAYTTFLNKLRADSFDAMSESLGRRGVVTAEEAKAISNFVNVATGRGDMGAAAQAAVGLNTVFFAPRLVLSRFQLIAGQPFYRGSARTRILMVQEYGRFLAGAGVVYALTQAAGAEPIVLDPRSPDFLKIKVGNTRIDPLAGITQATRFSLQEGQALKRFLTQSKEKVSPYMRGDQVFFRFLRTKLSPIFGGIVNAAAGQDVVGNKATPKSVATSLVVPMSFGDIYKTMQEQGVPKGTAIAILALFGMSVQTYDKKKR